MVYLSKGAGGECSIDFKIIGGSDDTVGLLEDMRLFNPSH